MIEMFPERGTSIDIEGGLLSDDSPCVFINDNPLTEEEVHTLVRHLMVQLEDARKAHYEKRYGHQEPPLKAVTE